MDKTQAIAIAKSINRHVRRNWHGGMFGWDYATFSVCFPRTCAVFNEAAEVITGRERRFLPRS